MSRYYSKLRKARYSHELRTYGVIPHFGHYLRMARNKACGLERCAFDDDCDYCSKPKKGAWVSMTYWAEDNPEADFYICGQCLVKNHYQHFMTGLFGGRVMGHPTPLWKWQKMQSLGAGAYICEWCGDAALGDCGCAAYKWHKENGVIHD